MKVFLFPVRIYAATKIFCLIHKATSISHIGKHFATDSDNYTLNYIESKMFRYKLNNSRTYDNSKTKEINMADNGIKHAHHYRGLHKKKVDRS